MYEKQMWTGIAPSPVVFAELDYEEIAVLALLCWSTVTNRPVTAADLAELEDRDGIKLGIDEARDIVRTLMDMKIASVFGMNNDRPLSVRLGGFQPRAPRRFADSPPPGRSQQASYRGGNPVASSPRRSAPGEHGGAASGAIPPSQSKAPRTAGGHWGIESRRRVEANLATTDRTPAFVLEEARKLQDRQVGLESGNVKMSLVGAAQERLQILRDRIALYERWYRVEPGHPTLLDFLTRKRKAVPELEFQVERARIKQAEMETDGAG